MTITELIERTSPPVPWAEGDNIPWSAPEFSKRMLKQHLSQDHDAASRRFEKIDEQVQWIHRVLLAEQSTRILELACGPGLYTSRLARLGHTCVGVDFAPAPLEYAQDCAREEGLACTYLHHDVRDAEYGEGFGLTMMISGQFNVFSRKHARRILDKAFVALQGDGLLLLEPQTYATVKGAGTTKTSWWSVPGGLDVFSAEPHLCLMEGFWDDDAQASTERYFVIDAATGNVTRHALSNEAYTEEQFRSALADAGFKDIRFFPSLVGVADESQAVNLAIVARKPALSDT